MTLLALLLLAHPLSPEPLPTYRQRRIGPSEAMGLERGAIDVTCEERPC